MVVFSGTCFGGSLPAWKCGLKFEENKRHLTKVVVTSCVEVWIEIVKGVGIKPQVQSLPAWKCGLKLIYAFLYTFRV